MLLGSEGLPGTRNFQMSDTPCYSVRIQSSLGAAVAPTPQPIRSETVRAQAARKGAASHFVAISLYTVGHLTETPDPCHLTSTQELHSTPSDRTATFYPQCCMQPILAPQRALAAAVTVLPSLL